MIEVCMETTMRHSWFALLSILLAAPIAAQPALDFGENAVVARGLTPGGPVAWFSVATERGEWLDVLVRRQIEAVADAKGGSSFELEKGVPALSVWAVVDLTTGAFDLAAPGSDGLREIPFPGDALRATPSGDVPFLEDTRSYLEVLLARPGHGAWGLTVGDGTADDADGMPDGRTRIAIDSLRPLTAGRAGARSVTAGDVIVVVDPNTMETYAATVGASQRP
jgi:hypothetical protein